jgi:ribosomal protection tetracycline resistance protein
MLHAAGTIRQVGSVDKGTSRSDTLEVERRRGISVRASALAFDWHETRIHLIDTPGHVDFAAEVERSLRVLDAAVLVLCAVDGVQAQTETIWRALEQAGLPVLLFINKLDRMGADPAAVMAQVAQELTPDLVPLNRPVDAGDAHAGVADPDEAQQTAIVEAVAATDEGLLDEWMAADGQLAATRWQPGLAQAIAARQLFPVIHGVAKNGDGVTDVLDAVVRWLPAAPGDTEAPLSALVYKLEHDERLGRVAGVRLFGGRLRTRDRVDNVTAERQEQVTQIKRLAVSGSAAGGPARLEDAGELAAGDIGWICGLPEVRIGDVLGDEAAIPPATTWTQPLLSVRVIPADDAQLQELAGALQQLSSEDPHLDVRWYAEDRELQVRIMGTVQTEILTEILRSRFGLLASFEAPTVIYRETPAAAGEGEESYTMPKPCWAIVRFTVDPLPPGSGVTFRSLVDKSDIAPKYQNEIAGRIGHALAQGPKGWEVTDVAVTLVEGCHHLLHSRPGDFKLATDMALLKALTMTDTTLLEPYLAFKVTAPEEHVGRITGDLIGMRAVIEPAQVVDGSFTMEGRLPLATSMDYAIRLSSLTGGRGAWAARFDGYEPCPPGEGVARDYRGISPLDRAKYILWWRSAITESSKSP